MLSSFSKFFVIAPILTLISLPGLALEPVRPVTTTTITTNLPGSPYLQHPHPLTRSSGYIFAGTVKSVERAVPKGNGVATVLINFHVDEAMRGVQTGQMLAIREWAGLWEFGERYRPGERVLLFLYPPSKLGLTSPVGGPLGRFRIGPDGHVILDPGRISFPAPRPHIDDPSPGTTRFTPREFVRLLRVAEEE
jgi:hypothetical protein